jgi:uncharacterized protein YxjI
MRVFAGFQQIKDVFCTHLCHIIQKELPRLEDLYELRHKEKNIITLLLALLIVSCKSRVCTPNENEFFRLINFSP